MQPTRALLGAAAAVMLWPMSGLAEGADHPFAEVPMAKLILVDTVAGKDAAVLEGPGGQMVIVGPGDRVALEGARVEKILRGCVALATSGSAPTLLCLDEASVPRS